MIVKIIKSSKPNWWYSNKIGVLFDVEHRYKGTIDEYFAVVGNGYLIEKEDCIDIREYREKKLKRILK